MPSFHGPQDIPFSQPISLKVGQKILVSGLAKAGSSTWSINFATAPSRGDSCDQLLHFGPRFNWRNDRNQVVINHKKNRRWGHEDRPSNFPFRLDIVDTVTIEVTDSCYKISVNDQHHHEFEHRVPIQEAKHIIIDGDVSLSCVHY